MCSQAEDHKCFGGLEAPGINNGEFFQYDIDMNTGSSTGATKTYWYQNANDAVVTTMNLGIPLGIFADTTATQNQVAAMTNMVNWGGDYTDTGSGKDHTTGRGSNGATTATMGLYWAIQDQPKSWWSQDLAIVQSAYQASTTDDLVARLNAASEFTGLTDLI